MLHAAGKRRAAGIDQPVAQRPPYLELQLHIHVLHHLPVEIVELPPRATGGVRIARHQLPRHVRLGIARMAAIGCDDVEMHRQVAVQGAGRSLDDRGAVDGENGAAGVAGGYQPVLGEPLQRLVGRHRRGLGDIAGLRAGLLDMVHDGERGDIHPQLRQVAVVGRREARRRLLGAAAA